MGTALHHAWSWIVAICLASTSTASCAEKADEDFEHWLTTVWQAATERSLERGVHVKLHVVQQLVPPASELEKMRERVKGHPQHPDLPKLQEYERILAGKPAGVTTRIWVRDGAWRSSTDHSNSRVGEYWLDDCVAGDQMWCLSAESLVKVDTGRDFPQYYDFRKHAGGVAAQVWAFATGGLSLVNMADMPVPKGILRGRTWEAITTTPAGAEFPRSLRMSGTWQADDKAGTIEEINWRALGAPDQGTNLFAEDWHSSVEFGGMIARRIREVTPDGRPDQTFTLLNCSAVSRDEIRRITATPGAQSTDVVRGASTFRIVHDFTGSQGVVTSASDDGSARVFPY